jgi:hypothetical protein
MLCVVQCHISTIKQPQVTISHLRIKQGLVPHSPKSVEYSKQTLHTHVSKKFGFNLFYGALASSTGHHYSFPGPDLHADSSLSEVGGASRTPVKGFLHNYMLPHRNPNALCSTLSSSYLSKTCHIQSIFRYAHLTCSSSSPSP